MPQDNDFFVSEKWRDEFAKLVKELLNQILDPHKNYKILEVWAGTGIVTNRLNELTNLQLVSLDVNFWFLEFGIRNKRIKANQTVVWSFTELPFEDQTFDLYIGIAILNHRDDIDKFYKEIVRVLKKGWLLIIPWVKIREWSIEREKAYFEKFLISVFEEGDWFLIGKK